VHSGEPSADEYWQKPNLYEGAENARIPDHMLEAIQRIKAYMAGIDRQTFEEDRRTQDAIIRNLEVLGEAARNVLQHDPAFAPHILRFRGRSPIECVMH
jgi:uncharacterized protein with HEPN domain